MVLKTEWISGDAKYGDSKLQTFNPLFPRGGYFGLVSLIGPANLFDIHPSLTLDLSKKVVLNMDCDIFWRYSKNDGIYGPNAVLIYPGNNTSHKFIGKQFSTDLVYSPTKFLYFRTEFTWFKAGGFLKEVSPGKDILFSAVTVQLKF
ncbi:MAG: alginate export family protein [Bacteroidota bacterium]